MSTAADAEVPARIIFLIGRPASGLPASLDLMSAPTCARMSLACPWATCRSPYRRFVEFDERDVRARQDVQADVAGRHRVSVREVEHPRIAARMHRFGEHQPAESPGVRRLADDDAGFIGLAVGGAGDEILPGLVPEMRHVVARFELHQRFEHRTGPGDLRRDRGNGRCHRESRAGLTVEEVRRRAGPRAAWRWWIRRRTRVRPVSRLVHFGFSFHTAQSKRPDQFCRT